MGLENPLTLVGAKIGDGAGEDRLIRVLGIVFLDGVQDRERRAAELAPDAAGDLVNTAALAREPVGAAQDLVALRDVNLREVGAALHLVAVRTTEALNGSEQKADA